MDQKSVVLNFLDTIKGITSLKPNLICLQKLQGQLRSLSKFLIQENNAELLMECILKYINLIINVSSSKCFREQIKICRNSFSIVTEIITERVQTAFVKIVTKRIFDIILDDDVESWCIKKELLKAYISCIQRADKNIRQETANELPNIYLFKMVDSISTYGDYDLQVTLIETVFRMYGKSTITSKLKDLIPESQQLSESFAEINGDTFDEDVRNFLNSLNETSGKVFSVICKSIHLGNIKCSEPMENVDGLWVDFNLSENAITWYCNKNSFSNNNVDVEDLDESNDRIWNLITLFVADVESVQIHRPIKSEDVLIFFKFKESCISSFDDNQEIIGAANDLKLIVSCNSKKIANLLSKVLPYLFKDRFFHNSSKVSSNKKSIYKPLNVSISRKTKSDSAKTKSDTSSFITFFDPISGKSYKSDLSTTLKDDISICKEYNMSSMTSKCEVISIPDGSTTATEQSLELVPLKDQMPQNALKSISSEYETAEICLNGHSEIDPKVSKIKQDKSVMNMNKLVDVKISKAKSDNSLFTHSSFSDGLFNVQKDIEKIQIFSRRCSSSNVRYSRLSKNSRLRASTLRKFSNHSKNNKDQIIKNHIYSDQRKENNITDESSTTNFQTAAEENGQTLISSMKISKSTDVLCEVKICREKMPSEYIDNFETAESQVSSKTVKMSKPKDVLQQNKFDQNFQKIMDKNRNLSKLSKMNKLKNTSINVDDILTEDFNNRTTINEKLPIKSDVYNLTQDIFHSNKTIEVDVEKVIVNNNLRGKKNLAMITEEFGAINFPKDNQKSIFIDDNTNILSSMIQDTENALKSVDINKSMYSGDEAITKLNISDAGSVNIVNKHLAVDSMKVNSKCEKTRKKYNRTTNLCPLKKRKQSCKTKFHGSNGIISDDLNKENIEGNSSFHKRGHSVEQSFEKIMNRTEQRKNVNSMELHPLYSNKTGDSVCHKMKKEDASNQNLLHKQLLVEGDRTVNQDKVINGEEQISSRKKVLEIALTNNSKKERTESNILDEEISNKKSEDVQTLNDLLIRSIDNNLKENEISNNLNICKAFTNDTDFKNSQEILASNDGISSEDEIPLKQLVEKWKREKINIIHFTQLKSENTSHGGMAENLNLHNEFEEIKSDITDNCEKTCIDLKKEIVTKDISIDKENMKSQVANLDNNNVNSKEVKTLKPSVPILDGLEKSVNLETIKKPNNRLEFNKQLDNLSKTIINNVFDTDMNNKQRKKSKEGIVEINTDQNIRQTLISGKVFTESIIAINEIDSAKDFNQTVSTTLGVRKKRKLYNPQDLSYLENSMLDDLTTKVVQTTPPIQLNEEHFRLNNLKKNEETSDKIVFLHECDMEIEGFCKKSGTLKTPIESDRKNSEISRSNKFERNYDTVTPLNNCSIKRTRKRYKTLKSPKGLKVVNPNTELKVLNNKNKCYSQLRPVFYNMLESFRKEVNTSFIGILEEMTPKKEETIKKRYIRNMAKADQFEKYRSIVIDTNVHTQKPSMVVSSSFDSSLNLNNKTSINDISGTTPPLVANSNCLSEVGIEKNNHKKINIISDIQIRPRCMLFEDNAEVRKKKNKSGISKLKNLPQRNTEIKKFVESIQTRKIENKGIVPLEIVGKPPVISEDITHEEISSWIVTGSPKYSQFSEKRRYVLKHTYPMFESLLTPQDSSQEYKDVLEIFNILKKYC